MKAKSSPEVVVKPGLKLIVLLALTLILLQFVTFPSKGPSVQDPAAFEEIAGDRLASCPEKAPVDQAGPGPVN
ncbi:MAG: hypothetical protein LBF58_10840 [Deltaproteobacteria bacterium]|jgi:hypothetical protein|nr:hypothetical protein [Deltaproteobacteria bacterium]